MSTKGTRDLTVPAKIFAVISCAFMTGFMWRARGSHGWGAMWGMFAVGVALTLFIYAFFGNKRKMSYESIPIAVLLLGITVGGWGTLNSQMRGYLGSSAAFTGSEEAINVAISPYAGMIIMLLLGFGWLPLFAVFIGSRFSKKEYKIWHYVILIGVFYLVAIACQFSVSHFILPKICPQAVDMFKQGLADRGKDMTPMAAYINKMGSAAFAKKIPFGRNYFTSIVVISRAIAALVVSLTALIAFRDKVTGFVSFGINLVSALAITISNIPMTANYENSLIKGKYIPAFLTEGGWSMWEFLTGFLLGFGIMLILVCLPKKLLNGEGKYKEKSFFGKKGIRYVYGSAAVLFFPLFLLPSRTFGLRLSDILKTKGIVSDDEVLGIVITAALSLIFFAVCMIIGKNNYLKNDLQIPVKMRVEDFCAKVLPVWFFANVLMYFFIDDFSVYSDIKGISSFLSLVSDGTMSVFAVTVIAVIIFYVFYYAALACAGKKDRKNG